MDGAVTRPAVRLVPVDAANFRAVVKLDLEPHQETFVASNVFSIAQSRVEPWWEPTAIVSGDALVGFAMYGREPESGNYWLCRIMISREHQRRGYGRAAMRAIVDTLGARPDCDAVWLSFVPQNTAARNLYLSLGFEDRGLVDDGETVVVLPLTGRGGHP